MRKIKNEKTIVVVEECIVCDICQQEQPSNSYYHTKCDICKIDVCNSCYNNFSYIDGEDEYGENRFLDFHVCFLCQTVEPEVCRIIEERAALSKEEDELEDKRNTQDFHHMLTMKQITGKYE